ncbi:unnamed protein product [Lymnaea stagnalis]|uniref:Ig-like domain-containing protein n=1 Tax=Lymnaea stagnalis TaxID=6523 RepID=A0AAV2I1M6_LYMST
MTLYEVQFILTWMAITFANEITITPQVEDLLIAYGNHETIRCSITVADRNFDLYWNFSHFSTASVVHDVVEVGDSFQIITDLNIQEFTPFDAGCFKCVAPQLHKEESVCLYGLNEKKTSAVFNYQDMLGVLHCLINFDHKTLKAMVLGWYLNKQSVLERDREKYFFDPTNGTLIIRRPRRIDTGRYFVKYEIKTDKSTTMYYTCFVDYYSAPLVLNMPKSKNLFIGQTLELLCEIISHPPSQAVWSSTNLNITPTDFRIILDNYNSHMGAKLTIRQIKFQDSGIYTCPAISPLFTNLSSKSIIFRGKNIYEWVWPFIGVIIQMALLAVMVIICSTADKNREKRTEDTLRRKVKKAEAKAINEEEARKKSARISKVSIIINDK